MGTQADVGAFYQDRRQAWRQDRQFSSETDDKMRVCETLGEDVQWAVEHTGITWTPTHFGDPDEIMWDPN